MKLLNSNTLKIFALIAMTIDHIGYFIFPDNMVYRMIGRLAMPIFAYFISEGCYYTRSKIKYFLKVFILGIGVLIADIITSGGFNMINLMLSFSMAILTIFCIENIFKSKYKVLYFILTLFLIVGMIELSMYIYFEYSIFVYFIPIVLYLTRFGHYKYLDNIYVRLILLTALLFLVRVPFEFYVHAFSFISIILLLFYNGKRGKYNIKYLFYIYYPLHVIVIYLISMLIL